MFKKTWVSPLMALSFTVVGFSGVLMLFHLRLPGMKGMHEWMGVLMVVVGLVHVLLNWKQFLAYFKTRSALIALAVGVMASIALLFASNGGDERHGPPPGVGIEGAR